MTDSLPSHEARIARVTREREGRIRERACIIFYGRPEGSITWPEADAMAFEQEASDQATIKF